MGTAKRANGSNKRLSEAVMYAALAEQHPDQLFIVPKQSRFPAQALNKAMRRAGLNSWTRIWKIYNPKTKEPERMYSVRFGKNVDKPATYREGAYEESLRQQEQQATQQEEQEKMNQLLAQKEPELVVADTLAEAVQYCRERGWKASKLAISRFDSGYPAKLAGVLNKQDVVEL